jgi:hypothetical protein
MSGLTTKEEKMDAKENQMQQIITRCWGDEEFKKRLMADPAKILDAEGVNLPDGVSIRVMEDTDQVRTLIIPPEPFHLDDDQLNGITGGSLCKAPLNYYFPKGG